MRAAACASDQRGLAAVFPDATRYATQGLVSSVDPLASSAGLAMLRAGGTAADAAVAASAVLAVTTPHMCGMGGDLLAVVHLGPADPPQALLAVGAAGSGADPEVLRTEGHLAMPMEGDIRTVTVPGCVDGWLALHARYGRLPLASVLEPARHYALEGFPVGALLAAVLPSVAQLPALAELVAGGLPAPGQLRRRTALGRAIGEIAHDGREAWYGGDFGQGLLDLGAGWFHPDDLARPTARWTPTLSLPVGPLTLHTTPAPSQGYLTLAALGVLEQIGVPTEPEDPAWAHLLVEIARTTGADRPTRLYDGAADDTLLSAQLLDGWARRVDRERAGHQTPPTGAGGTIYLCAVDADGGSVSLSQSNAAGFGSKLGVPSVGVLLHNRGVGFSLDPDSPNLLGPGRRPTHTLAPLLGSDSTGTTCLLAGTMGGDAQPQILLQLLSRLQAGQTPGQALAAPRWSLASPSGGGFDTWGAGTDAAPVLTVRLEQHANAEWEEGLRLRGHVVERVPARGFGHAHLAVRRPDGVWAAAADPRAAGSAAVW